MLRHCDADCHQSSVYCTETPETNNAADVTNASRVIVVRDRCGVGLLSMKVQGDVLQCVCGVALRLILASS